jgi:hypothetical protein
VLPTIKIRRLSLSTLAALHQAAMITLDMTVDMTVGSRKVILRKVIPGDAAIIGRDHAKARRRQPRNEAMPDVPGLWKSVEENRGAIALVRPDMMQPNARLDIDHAVNEGRLCVLSWHSHRSRRSAKFRPTSWFNGRRTTSISATAAHLQRSDAQARLSDRSNESKMAQRARRNHRDGCMTLVRFQAHEMITKTPHVSPQLFSAVGL